MPVSTWTGSEMAAERNEAPVKNIPETRGNRRRMVSQYVSFTREGSSYAPGSYAPRNILQGKRSLRALTRLRGLRRRLQPGAQGEVVEQRGCDGRPGDHDRHGKRRVIDESKKYGCERGDQKLVRAKQRGGSAGNLAMAHHGDGRSVGEHEPLRGYINEDAGEDTDQSAESRQHA